METALHGLAYIAIALGLYAALLLEPLCEVLAGAQKNRRLYAGPDTEAYHNTVIDYTVVGFAFVLSAWLAYACAVLLMIPDSERAFGWGMGGLILLGLIGWFLSGLFLRDSIRGFIVNRVRRRLYPQPR